MNPNMNPYLVHAHVEHQRSALLAEAARVRLTAQVHSTPDPCAPRRPLWRRWLPLAPLATEPQPCPAGECV